MTLTIGMVSIDSADPAPLAQWWAERLGAEVVADNGGWFYVVGSTPVLGVQAVPDPTPGKNRIHLDLATPDVEAATEELLAAGARLVERRSQGRISWTTFEDPQGNQFCVSAH